MITYQDFQNTLNNGTSITNAVESVISAHQGSSLYLNARVANDYFNGINRTIEQLKRKWHSGRHSTKEPLICLSKH